MAENRPARLIHNTYFIEDLYNFLVTNSQHLAPFW